jgi:hypothetical protein
MIIFMQILIVISFFIFCYFYFKPSPIDEVKKEWISIPYNKLTDTEVERMIGKPKNIINIDYEIDDGNTVYFEIKPSESNPPLNSEGAIIKELIDKTPEPTMRIVHEGFSLSPLTSVITKEIPTKYNKC